MIYNDGLIPVDYMSRLRFAKPVPCGAIQYIGNKVGKNKCVFLHLLGFYTYFYLNDHASSGGSSKESRRCCWYFVLEVVASMKHRSISLLIYEIMALHTTYLFEVS